MSKFKKSLFTIAILLFGGIFTIAGCARDVYKNLKLELSATEQTIFLSDNHADNVFAIFATVSGRPKKYDGQVIIENTNTDAVEEVKEERALSGGVTSAKFVAKNPGRAILTFVTAEGSKQKQVIVNVEREVVGLGFTVSNLPLVKNNPIDIKNYINYNPLNTSQKDVELILSLPEGSVYDEAELNKIQVSGTEISVPSFVELDAFIVNVKSVNNETIISEVGLNVVVLDEINTEFLNVYYDNNTPSVFDDIALEKEGNNYILELSGNTPDKNSLKEIYFTFVNEGVYNSDLKVEILEFYSDFLEIRKSASVENGFTFSSLPVVSDTEVNVNFVIKYKQYQDNSYSSLFKHITIKVKINVLPKEILLTGGDLYGSLPVLRDKQISEISLFDNYETTFGTPVGIVLTDEVRLLNQNVSISFNRPVDGRVEIRDEFGTLITNWNNINSGLIYISHSYSQHPSELQFTVTSNRNTTVIKTIDVNFIRGAIKLDVLEENKYLKINTSDNSIHEFGYAEVIFENLPTGFNKSLLTATVVSGYDSSLVQVVSAANSFGFKGLGKNGETRYLITAPNGSSVIVYITTFEAMIEEQTKVYVAGIELNALTDEYGNYLSDITAIRNAGYVFGFRNSIPLDISFLINNTHYSFIPANVSVLTTAYDIVNNAAGQTSSIVRKSNNMLLETLNSSGESLITITLRGYNEYGNQDKTIIFNFIIKVDVVLNSLTPEVSGVEIYAKNYLGYSYSSALGEHKIRLKSSPLGTNINFESVSWGLQYYSNLISAIVTDISQSQKQYRFNLGSSGSYVLMLVNNTAKEATVSAYMSATENIEVFTVFATYRQEYLNSGGNSVVEINEARVSFTVRKPVKVEQIIFSNISNNTLTFDARDLGYNGSEFTSSVSDRTKYVYYNVLPSNSLLKDLDVFYEDNSIDVKIVDVQKLNTSTGVYETVKAIEVIALNTISSGRPVPVYVYSKDSLSGEGIYSLHEIINVEILDGRSEELAFKVSTVSDLARINNNLNAYYVLTNNIEVNTNNWSPIGYMSDGSVSEFGGSLSGAYAVGGETLNYTISGLGFSNNETSFNYNYMGLFAIIAETGVVKNIDFNNIFVNIEDNVYNNKSFIVAGVVAGLNKGIVLNVNISDGSLIETLNGAGFESYNTFINGIYYKGTNNQQRLVALGGVVGVNYANILNTTVKILINSDSMTNTTTYIGGVTGINYGNAVIANTNNSEFNGLDVISAINVDRNVFTFEENSAIGGAVGFNNGNVLNLNTKTYILKANNNVGGLIGFNASKAVAAGVVTSESLVSGNTVQPVIRGNEFVGGLIGYSTDEAYSLNWNLLNNYTNISKVDGAYSAAVVTSNLVEMLDNNDNVSLYNTAIIANNYAGGLIGGLFNSFEFTLHPNGLQSLNFKNALTYNSVFSYNSDNQITNQNSINNNLNNSSYFGDILLNNIHSPSTTNANRNYAAGLVGKVTNGFMSNNSVYLNIQATGAVVSGLVGEVDGYLEHFQNLITGQLLINNSSFQGNLINNEVINNSNITPLEALFVGDATEGAMFANDVAFSSQKYNNMKIFNRYNVFNSYGYAVNKDDQFIEENVALYKVDGNNTKNIQLFNSLNLANNLNLVVTWQDENEDNYFVKLLNVNALTGSNNEGYLFGGVIEFTYNINQVENAGYGELTLDSLFNNNATVLTNGNVYDAKYFYSTTNVISEDYFLNNLNHNNANFNYIKNFVSDYDFKSYNLVNDAYGIGINENEIDSLMLELETYDFSLTGLSDLEKQYKIELLAQLIEGKLQNLNNQSWFMFSELNGGMPVLLSANKFSLTFNAEQDVLEFEVLVNLLANWIPSDILVGIKSNYETAWINSLSSSLTLFVNKIDSRYFNGDVINFESELNLNNETSKNLTSDLLQKIKSLNTYGINDVLNIQTIPAFIGKHSINVISSKPEVLSVEWVNGKLSLVARASGNVTLTISSSYNNSLFKIVNVSVVSAITSPNEVLGEGLKFINSNYGKNTQLNKFDEINLIKTNENITDGVTSLIIKAEQNNIFNYNSALIGTVKFNMPVNNNLGVRYYLLNTINYDGINYNSIYHSNNVLYEDLYINNGFIREEVVVSGELKYVYYTNVSSTEDAVFVGYNESDYEIFAVPYISNNNNETLLINNNYLLNNMGIVSEVGVNEFIENLFGGQEVLGAEFAYQFKVNILNGTWGIELDYNNVAFDPSSSFTFTTKIKTDNKFEILYVNYENENGVSTTRGIYEHEIINGLPVIKNETGFVEFEIGRVSLNVYYVYDEISSEKIYTFNLYVKDENRMIAGANNSFEVIKQIFSRNLNVFTLASEDDVETVYYDNGENTIKTNIDLLKNNINYEKFIQFTLNPQDVVSHVMEYYPNGELQVVNGVYVVNLTEVAYDNILPGYSGILKININPYYANYDYIILQSTTSGIYTLTFEQMLAEYTGNSQNMLHKGTYVAVGSSLTNIDNGIMLTKQSYILNGLIDFDGFIYVRVLLSSFANESDSFTLVSTPYSVVNGVSVSKAPAQINLNVITPPSLNMNYKGDKNAAIALGTNIDFNVAFRGLTSNDEIDFSESYIRNAAGNIISSYNSSYFNIRKINDTTYRLTTSATNLMEGYFVVIRGSIYKEINGEIHTYTDELVFKLADFVVDGISVNNVINGRFIGVFNQVYDLTVKVNATYSVNNPRINEILSKIYNLELELSTINLDNLSNHGWYYIDTFGFEVKINSLGYNNARSYVISHGILGGDYAPYGGFKLQNIKYNSNDVLGYRARLVYRNNGVDLLNNTESAGVDADYYYEVSTTFSFGFYRVSSEDRPEPIRTADELLNMETGVNYILLNDIVLENHIPINTDIASLDGNGFVITIKSFDTPNRGAALISGADYGLFGVVSEITTLKNLTVEIAPNSFVTIASERATNSEAGYVDLDVNMSAYSAFNFGVIAGTNRGIITNSLVTYDASSLRLERDLLIVTSDSSNPEFSNYFVNGTFNYKVFLSENSAKYFPRATIINASNLWQNGAVNYSAVTFEESKRRDLSVLRVVAESVSATTYTRNIGGLVGINYGYITNSGVENITISGVGYVAGLAAVNSPYTEGGKISSSYFKGGNIINRTDSVSSYSGTAGLVVDNLNGAFIQYSYVAGRDGDGNDFVYGSNENDLMTGSDINYLVTPSTYADKTGLSEELKDTFAGSQYNSKATNPNDNVPDEEKYNYNYKYGALRAMNSMVWSTSSASGFVYNNSGTISNSYSNILTNSSARVAGFVYNNSGGYISDVYSLSSVQVGIPTHSPFTGKNEQGIYNNINGTIEYSFYLKASGSLLNLSTNDTFHYEDNFSDMDEFATPLTYSAFGDYNTFQGFAFNTDYDKNEEISESVWFIPNGLELGNNALKNLKHSYYLQNRPELVAANLRTLSVRVLASAFNNMQNDYTYISEVAGNSSTNPILVRSAEEFNRFIATDKYEDDSNINNQQTNSLRLVRDIAFNAFDSKAITYNIDYSGSLDGNGMAINNLRIVSETTNSSSSEPTKLGLFGSISSIYDNQNGNLIQRANVRNLQINVDVVFGTYTNFVGVLAGVIENAYIYNISINGSNMIQGGNVVGALAGYIVGDSEVVNISVSGLGLKASYVNTYNPSSLNSQPEAIGMFNMFSIENAELSSSETFYNLNSVSYVGGVAGIINTDSVKDVDGDEDFTIASNLRSAKVRKVMVSSSRDFVGEVVGGVVGGMTKDSSINDAVFVVNSNSKFIASRIAGGIVADLREGSLNRSVVRHETNRQNIIDNAVKVATETGATINNHSENINTLYSGNATYIGGIVGFNYGGDIFNSYNKVNVVNLVSRYAGGITGVNVSGSYNNAYTTANVNAHYSVGGVVGLLLQPHAITQTQKWAGFVVANNQYGLLSINLTSNPFTVYNEENPQTKTKFYGVVASNIWALENNAVSVTLVKAVGSFVGEILMNGLTYDLKNVFEIADSTSVSVRQISEVNYFVKANVGNSNTLMNEIGEINNSVDYVLENDVRGGNELGVSGAVYRANGKIDGSVNYATAYYYSRLQNLGSLRTTKEIINRVLDLNADSYFNDEGNRVKLEDKKYIGQEEYTISTIHYPLIYKNWPINFWQGVRTEKIAEETYAFNDNYVFPYLVPVASQGEIEVYDADDLALMRVYTAANFILMNDITLQEDWEPAGSALQPFSGSITSYGNDVFTISGLKITDAGVNSYVGLVGYARNATFTNFNLVVDEINITNVIPNTAYYVGSLYGYGRNIRLTKVNVAGSSSALNSGITADSVAGIGAIAGASIQTTLTNVSASGFDIKVNSVFSHDNTNQNISVGGAFGWIEGTYINAVLNFINVYDVNINVVANNQAQENENNINHIMVGGVAGYLSSGSIGLVSLTGMQFDSNNNKIEVNLSSLTANSNNVYVGGLVGSSNSIAYLSRYNEETNNIESYGLNVNANGGYEIEITTNNSNNNINVGGAFGEINGLSTLASSVHVNDAYVGNVDVSLVNNSSSPLSQNKSVNIGGFAGYSYLTNIKNVTVKSNIEILYGVYNIYDSTNMGGLIGLNENILGLSNIISESNITNTGIGKKSINNNMGGLVGKLNVIGTGEKLIEKVVSTGEINSNSGTTSNISGLIGLINYNGSSDLVINESLSSSNIKVGGLLLSNNSNVSDKNATGGLVGKLNNSLNGGGFTLTNSYYSGDITFHGYYENTGADNSGGSGGLIGNINSTSQTINILNSYSISKISYNVKLGNSSYLSYDPLMENTKNGGLVGFINNNSLLNIENSYYNLDLAPYSNNYGTALDVRDMLFNSAETTTENNETTYVNFAGFEDSGIWSVLNNKYPLLTWVQNSDNVNIRNIQSEGMKTNPNYITSQNVEIEDGKSYVVGSAIINSVTEENLGGGEFADNYYVYFTNNSSSFSSLSNVNGFVYGAKITGNVTTNNGFITNSSVGGNVSTNAGILFNSKINTISTNSGIIDKVAKNNNYDFTTIITNNAMVVSSVARVDGGGGIVNSSYYDNDNSNYTYYYNTSINIANRLTITGVNGNVAKKFTETDSYEISAYDGWNNSGSFDFENDWVLFTVGGLNSGDKTTLLNGRPILRWTLKTNWYDEKLKSDYNWSDNLTAVIPTGNVYNISSAQELAWVANQVNSGNDLFNGKTINIIENIDLSGKLWAPIGTENNPFEGKVLGNSNIISNIGVLTSSKHAGLFGVVNINAGGSSISDSASFVNSLIMENGFVALINNNNSHSISAGALAGLVKYNTTDEKNYIINGFGNQFVNVYANYNASGVIGVINKTQAGNAAGVVIYKTYNRGKVHSHNASSYGFTYNNDAYGDNSLIYLREVYFNGSFGGNGNKYAFADGSSSNLSAYRVLIGASTMATGSTNTSAYANASYVDNSLVGSINPINFRTANLLNFDWENSWLRVSTMNDLNPVFDGKINYWILDVNDFEHVPETNGNTYDIENAKHLAWLAKQVNINTNNFEGKIISINNNINLSDKLWTPIGTETTTFKGTVEGNNNSVSGIVAYRSSTPSLAGYQANSSAENLGLFGVVENATIKNLNVGNSENISIIHGTNNVGGLVGYVKNSVIENIENYAYINAAPTSGTDANIGGVIGKIEDGEVSDLTNNGLISSLGNNTGGIIGHSNIVIENSENAGSVVGVNNTGGIVGYTTATVQNNINTANVSGVNNVGGVVGFSTASVLNNRNTKQVGESVNVAKIYGTNNVGGIVGYLNNSNALITGMELEENVSDNTGEVVGVESVGGIAGYSNATIEGVTNNALVSGVENVGGVVGKLFNASIFETINSANITLLLNSTGNIGGVAGNITYDATTRVMNLLFSGTLLINGNSSAQNIGLVVGSYSGSTPTINNTNMLLSVNATGSVNIFGNTSVKIQTVGTQSTINGNSVTFNNPLTQIAITEKEAYSNSSIWNSSYSLNYKKGISKLKPTGGDGSENNPFIMENADNTTDYLIYHYGKRFNYTDSYKYFKLNASQVWSFIQDTGSFVNKVYPFIGSFDGGGNEYLIDFVNLGSSYSALFKTAYNSVFKNFNFIILSSAPSNNYSYVGTLVGKGIDLEIENVVIQNNTGGNHTIRGASNIGALAGELINSTVADITNGVTINAASSVGGIVGSASITTFNDIKNNAIITATGNNVGGIVGIGSTITIQDSNNTANISGVDNVGGIAGNLLLNSNIGEGVSNNNASGTVEGANNVGGIVGYVNNGTVFGSGGNIISNNASIIADGSYVGGIVGRIESSGGRLEYLRSNGDVQGKGYIGGIVGGALTSTISVSNVEINAEIIHNSDTVEIIDLWALENDYKNATFAGWGLINNWQPYQTTWKWVWYPPFRVVDQMYAGRVHQYNLTPGGIASKVGVGKKYSYQSTGYTYGLVSGNGVSEDDMIEINYNNSQVLPSYIKQYYKMNLEKIGWFGSYELKYSYDTYKSGVYSENLSGGNSLEVDVYEFGNATVTSSARISAGLDFLGSNPQNRFKDNKPVPAGDKVLLLDLGDPDNYGVVIFYDKTTADEYLSKATLTEGLIVSFFNGSSTSTIGSGSYGVNIYNSDENPINSINRAVPGSYEIEITYKETSNSDKTFRATYVVTILDTDYTLSVNSDNAKTLYDVGEEFNYIGLNLNITRNGQSFGGFTLTDSPEDYNYFVSYIDISEYDSSTPGRYKIIVKLELEEGAGTIEAEYYVEVAAISVAGNSSHKTSYKIGEDINYSNLSVNLITPTGSVQPISATIESTDFNKDQVGKYDVSISYIYNGKKLISSYQVEVVDLSVNDAQSTKVFAIGEEFNVNGLIVSFIDYSGSSELSLGDGGYQIINSNYNSNAVGVYTVEFSYTSKGLTWEFEYDVEVVNLKVDENNSVALFQKGSMFNLNSDVSVEFYAGDGSMEIVTPLSANAPALTEGVFIVTGDSIITVTYNYKGKELVASYNVSVIDLTLNTENAAQIFELNSEFDSNGLEVWLHDASGQAIQITEGYLTSGYDLSVLGEQLIEVSYVYTNVNNESITLNRYYNIEVVALEIDLQNTKTLFQKGNEFDIESNLTVKLLNSPGNGIIVDDVVVLSDGIVSNHLTNVGVFNVEVTYVYTNSENKSLTLKVNYEIEVVDLNVDVSNAKLLFEKDDLFSVDDLKVWFVDVNENELLLNYDNGEFTISGYSSEVIGTQELVVTYAYTNSQNININLTQTYTVEVVELTLNISNVKTVFKIGESFSYAGLIVEFENSDGKQIVQTYDTSPYIIDYSSYNRNIVNEYEIIVKYVYNSYELIKTYNVEVVEHLNEIVIDFQNAKLIYSETENFDPETAGIEVWYYNNLGEKTTENPLELDVDYSINFSDFNFGQVGEYLIIVNYLLDGEIPNVVYYVNVMKLNKIEISGNFKTQYVIGEDESFDFDDLQNNLVVMFYNEIGESSVVNYDNYTVNTGSFNVSVAGEYEITINYLDDYSATFMVNVSDGEIGE